MEYDAFSAGVNPGGLRSKQDIKILICYMLDKLDLPLKKSDITSILQNYGLANYFEVSEAFSDLVSSNNITPDKDDCEIYNLTSSGELITQELAVNLPATVKEKSIANAKLYFERMKREKENRVSIKKNDRGYDVTCSVSGGKFDMLSITLYVPDIQSANVVRDNFYDNPEKIYTEVLNMMTYDNKKIASELFNIYAKSPVEENSSNSDDLKV